MIGARVRAVVGLLVLAATVVAGRAFQISILEHEEWSERARRQHEDVISVSARRGAIRSADGYVLAASEERVAVQVDTHLVEIPELFARAAAPMVGAGEQELLERLVRGSRSVWLAQQLDPEVADQIRELEPHAVFCVPDSARVYPQGRLAAPVLGFVGREELTTVGRAGLEHHFDSMLAGERESFLIIKDGIPRRVRAQRLHGGRPGFDLQLTLHARLQAAAETALERAVDDVAAVGGSVVVLDAVDGAVLALASAPSFDPASPGREAARWRLRPVQDALEPGSTTKPLIAAAARASARVSPDDLFDCTSRGSRVAGFWIRDHAGPGIYDLEEVIVHSSNAGIIEVADRVPEGDLHRALAAFGFGARTEIGFPAEARGILQPVERWSRLSRSGLALGQELTVTPLQLALAYAAVANGGWLLRPRLVERAIGGDGEVAGARECRARVLDEELALEIRGWLERAVVEGTGDRAAVSGYRVAGKTGTAQRAVGGTFDDDHHTAWFAGFLPLPSPRLVIVVAIEDPRRDFWASAVAAPVFAEVAAAAARLLELPPEPVGAQPSGEVVLAVAPPATPVAGDEA